MWRSGVNLEGNKEVLGAWAAQSEGAKFWLPILTELQSRGVKDILMACVDGLKGFPGTIEAVFPRAEVQLCIVHLVRASLNYALWKQRKEVAADLKFVYQAATAVEAEWALGMRNSPSVSQVWPRNRGRIIPFVSYPADIRRAIYTSRSSRLLVLLAVP